MTLEKFRVSSIKSIAWEWNHITMGHLWKLYWGWYTAWAKEPLVTLPFESLVLSWPWQHFPWALDWMCVSWSASNLPYCLCCLPLSRNRWAFIVPLVVLLIAWLWTSWMWLVCVFSILYINVYRVLRTEWRSLKTIRYLWKLSYGQDKYRWLGSPLKRLLREASDPVLGKKREGLALFSCRLWDLTYLDVPLQGMQKILASPCCPLLPDGLSSLLTQIISKIPKTSWIWCLFCSPPMYPVIISINNGCWSIYELITSDWGIHSDKICWLPHFPDEIFMTWRFHLYKSQLLCWLFFFHIFQTSS